MSQLYVVLFLLFY